MLDCTHGGAPMMSVEVTKLGIDLSKAISDVVTSVSLTYAKEVQGRLQKATPPKPRPGSMVWKSEKQRRFVMAMISQGKIKVPYERGQGNGLRGSQSLNRGYRVDKEGLEAVLYNAASYAPYVVGDQQAQIHRDRWATAMQVAADIARDGTLDQVVEDALRKAGLS